VTWRLRTPDRLITTNLLVNYTTIPNDVNTLVTASLDPITGVGSISISTEEKTLTVRQYEGIIPGSINLQGAIRVPLLGLIVDNGDAIDVDTVLVDSLNCQLINNNDRTTIGHPNTIINRLEVVNMANYRAFAKIQQSSQIYADFPLTADTPDIFGVNFTENILRLDPGEIDTLVILADLNDAAPNSSFIFKVNDIWAYVGTRDNVVKVVDANGTDFNESVQGESQIVSVLTQNEEDQFFNFPNPFGADVPETRFVFFMDAPGSAELKIYTLMGGLVYSRQEDNLSGSQVYDGLFTWDGTNNSGNRVLNGVYIAILKTNSKTFKTKVAYIK
jgi:hypothetical protein